MNLEEEFAKLKRAYDNNEFEKIFNHKMGTLFLKLRSLSRTAILQELAKKLHVDISKVEIKNYLSTCSV